MGRIKKRNGIQENDGSGCEEKARIYTFLQYSEVFEKFESEHDEQEENKSNLCYICMLLFPLINKSC